MDLTKLKNDVAKHLGVGATHFAQRFDRLVGNLAASIESDLKQTAAAAHQSALDQIGGLTLRDVSLLLAEGPTEQTRALLTPEQIHKTAPEAESTS